MTIKVIISLFRRLSYTVKSRIEEKLVSGLPKSTDKEKPSTGAVPRVPQKKNKCYLEMATRPSVPTGSQRFGGDKSSDDQAAAQTADEARRKKRTKSVTFLLDDAGSSKKSKDEAPRHKHASRTFRNSHAKHHKKNRVHKVEEVQLDEMVASTSAATPVVSKKLKLTASNKKELELATIDEVNDEKKEGVSNTESNNPPQKRKKAKHSRNKKPFLDDSIQDELTLQLENLHIGDKSNLSNLFHNMVLASPNLKKRNRKCKLVEPPVETDVNSNIPNEFNLKNVVKWTKKRWNKDRKGVSIASNQCTSVVVQNLPRAMSSVYRKKLADVFEEFGRIKRIGPAEMGPDTDGETGFSTTIYFETGEAATKALEQDYLCFCGSAIRVIRPLPPTETTAVARSYSHLPIKELRAIFGGAGPLRNVRAGKRRNGHMALAFLEFNGPEAVQRALALSGSVSINGKLIYVNKFEIRDLKDQQRER